MKIIYCNEVGEIYCDFIASGETDQEVKRLIVDHIIKEHIENHIEDHHFEVLDLKIDRILLYQ